MSKYFLIVTWLKSQVDNGKVALCVVGRVRREWFGVRCVLLVVGAYKKV